MKLPKIILLAVLVTAAVSIGITYAITINMAVPDCPSRHAAKDWSPGPLPIRDDEPNPMVGGSIFR